MFDPLVNELSERYGLGDRGRDLFGLLVAYIHNDRRGGFGGFVEAFREQGHGELLSSWLGNSSAGGLNAGDVGTVFGQGLLSDWGTRLGVSRATVAAAIAGVLPRLVAELTPGGRIPGGFGAASSLAGDEAGSYRARPGVEGLIAPERDAGPAEGYDDLGPIAPGQEPSTAGEPTYFDPPRHQPQVSEPASQPMRRETYPAHGSPAVRSPMEARREHEAAAIDPAEQRVADMAAAFDLRAERPPGWRSAVHPPRRGRGFGWFWLLLLLIVGAGGYAWWQGMLNPYLGQVNAYLQQFGVMVPTPEEAGLR